jgi:hypothetical protein
MNANTIVSEIEYLRNPNKVKPVSMPTMEITESNYINASKESLFAVIQQQQRQLKDALRSLSIASADLNDSHDIIKQWRAHNGFVSDQNGEIRFTSTDTPWKPVCSPTVH